MFFSDYEQLKKIRWNHRKGRLWWNIYELVDEVETDLYENVANEMNDSDTELLENDELDSSGFCSDLRH